MSKLEWRNKAWAAVLLWATAPIGLSAQTFKTLHSFDGTDGASPSGLVQATGGNLYGTTAAGGVSAVGTVFKIRPGGGPVKTLYSFNYLDGSYPEPGLVQAAGGNFYGTTTIGGANNSGTVFRITPSGSLTTLYSFCSQSGCTDGDMPQGGLVQATGGNLYGTTSQGGAATCSGGCGTVFRITPSGSLATLYGFCSKSGCHDGSDPRSGLVQGTNGNFYGTTARGGAHKYGTIFKITPSGSLTTLYSFCSQSSCTDGFDPGALVQATDGNLYGTTTSGGANTTDCGGFGCGTIFKITPSGSLTTLYSFCSQSSCTDGASPDLGLVQATDGNLYGTTGAGGANMTDCFGSSCGTFFKITPSGTLTTLYSFCTQSGCTDGFEPGALVQDTNGMFYGTTYAGGKTGDCYGDGCGTVFSLSVGLGPFVKTQPDWGRAGRFVEILGTNLSGATSVSFNGTPAVFRVVPNLNSLIKTTVPEGATTGTVEVVTPGGTLSSNVPFRVLP